MSHTKEILHTLYLISNYLFSFSLFLGFPICNRKDILTAYFSIPFWTKLKTCDDNEPENDACQFVSVPENGQAKTYVDFEVSDPDEEGTRLFSLCQTS